ERSRPEDLGEPHGALRNIAHPSVQVARAVEVHDHRVMRGATFHLEDPAHGGWILRVGAQAVDGLRWKGNELAVAQRLHGGLDLDLGGSDDADHRLQRILSSHRGSLAACCRKASVRARVRVACRDTPTPGYSSVLRAQLP